MECDLTKLSDHIDEFAKQTFPSFEFRPGQKETIIKTITSWCNGTKNVILDAPTGSGKSYVALITAGVLSKYYKKRGYILISDLSLLKQYMSVVDVYLPEWGMIQGQANYKCTENGFKFPIGACKLAGCTSYQQIQRKYPDCYKVCPYIMARERAITANVTLCTYSYWLIQRNMTRSEFSDSDNESQYTDKRDFVICDEAHKLVDIVQSHYAPKISKMDAGKIDALCAAYNIPVDADYKDVIDNYRIDMTNNAGNKDYVLPVLKGYYNRLYEVFHIISLLKENKSAKTKLEGNVVCLELPADFKLDKRVVSYYDWFKDYLCKFYFYIRIIESLGIESMVISPDLHAETISFNCIDDSYMMKEYFHDNCKNVLYMSATIGDFETFAQNIDIAKWESIKLPSLFDYSKSPIYCVPEYKMSYRDKDTSLPYIAKMIDNIMKMYRGQRGIIQTGNYNFGSKIGDLLSPENTKRLFVYNDTGNKKQCLDDFYYSKDGVLVGPSLIEGLSLDNDLCRFQIMMKVPYPSLSDNYVKEKMEHYPSWYESATSIAILQGVGRGVRTPDDWCVTFILDGCFVSLLNSSVSMFPDEFKKRLVALPANTLLNLSIADK